MRRNPAVFLRRAGLGLGALLLPLPAAAAGLAPVAAAEIVGEVVDPVGAPIPGAAVQLWLPGGELREMSSDQAGEFRFDTLPEGPHRLIVESAGFATRTMEVTVGGAGEVRVSVPLDVAFAEAVTVIGTQVERHLHLENASVSIVGAERLQTNTEENLYDLVALTPNVNAASRAQGFSIRGINQRGFGSSTGMLVNVQVDGVSAQRYEATRYGPFSTWDLERVEVFRGPQSTQQGRNALAGAIIMRSTDPLYQTEVRARARLGNANASQLAAAVNIPLVENRAAVRLTAERRRTDGFLTNPTLDDDAFGAERYQNLRAKLRFDPASRFRGLVTLTRTSSEVGDSGLVSDRFPGERVNLSDSESAGEATQQSAVVELGLDVAGPWILESLSTLTTQDYQRLWDLDQSPVPTGFLDIGIDNEWMTQELRLRYVDEHHAHGVVGLYFADLEDRVLADAAGPGVLAGLPPGFLATAYFDIESATRNAALFGEFDLHFGPDWSVTLGARYDREDFEQTTIQGLRVEPDPGPIFPGGDSPPLKVDASYGAFLPKASVLREWTDVFATSLGWQRGYRSGGQSVAVISQQVADYGPEFVDNFEFAVRADSPDHRWNLHWNAFYTSWTDQQVRIMTDLGLPVDTITANAGESTLYGMEVEAGYRPTRDIDLYATAGLLEARFDRFIDEGNDYTGKKFPFTPPWSLAGGIAVRHGSSWSGRAEVSSQGAAFSDPRNDPRFKVGARTLVNVRAGYRVGSWGIFAFGRNLLDEQYLTSAWQHPIPEFGGLGRAGEPRVFGIELDVTFR